MFEEININVIIIKKTKELKTLLQKKKKIKI